MPGGFDTPFEQTRVQLQLDEEEQAQNPATKATQEAFRRRLLAEKKALKEKATDAIKKKLAQKVGTRLVLRVVGAACASSIIFLIVTWLIWTVQALAGNLMGSKWIPELEWWEIILWGILTIIILAIVIILITLSSIAIVFSNPLLAISILGTIIFEAVTGS
ncbi:MAG: hypothetical protein WCV71_02700 [Patescibacteria group bacterium]